MTYQDLCREILSSLSVNISKRKLAIVNYDRTESVEGTIAMEETVDEWREKFREIRAANPQATE